MPTKALIGPLRYVQGPGALDQLPDLLPAGGRPAIVASPARHAAVGDRIRRILEPVAQQLTSVDFGGECSDDEIGRIGRAVDEQESDVLIAVGGGKTIDVSKAVGARAGLDTVVVPTIAATDAPTAAAAIVYTADGVFDRAEIYARSPALVVVDTDIIRAAPARFLVSGMGDALATWFEADACLRSGATTVAGGRPTEAALAIARRCWDVLLADGTTAVADLDGDHTTDAIERVVEANTLLSGIGFESGGLAAAHSIHNGFTAIDATHAHHHGEKVAFSTICQLLLEERLDDARAVRSFCLSVGLPARLADLSVDPDDDEGLGRVAEKACAPGETIHNMPVEITTDTVLESIRRADALS